MFRKNGRASPRESDNVHLCKLHPPQDARHRWSVERSAWASREPKRVGGRVGLGVREAVVAEHPPPLCRLEVFAAVRAGLNRPVNRRIVYDHPDAVAWHPRALLAVSHAARLMGPIA